MTDIAPLTNQQLADIRQRAETATPGPWEARPHDHFANGCRCLSCMDPVVGWTVDHPQALHCDDLVAKRTGAGELNDFRRPLSSCEDGPLLTFADAEFAAHARQDVPALLTEIDRLRAQLAGVWPCVCSHLPDQHRYDTAIGRNFCRSCRSDEDLHDYAAAPSA